MQKPRKNRGIPLPRTFQSLLCYRYTIPQKDFLKLGGLENGVKIKGPVGEIQNPKSEKRNNTTKHTNDTKEKENSRSSFVCFV